MSSTGYVAAIFLSLHLNLSSHKQSQAFNTLQISNCSHLKLICCSEISENSSDHSSSHCWQPHSRWAQIDVPSGWDATMTTPRASYSRLRDEVKKKSQAIFSTLKHLGNNTEKLAELISNKLLKSVQVDFAGLHLCGTSTIVSSTVNTTHESPLQPINSQCFHCVDILFCICLNFESVYFGSETKCAGQMVAIL